MNILYRKSEKPHNHGPAIQLLSKSSDIPLIGPTQGFFTEIAMSLNHTPAVVGRAIFFYLVQMCRLLRTPRPLFRNKYKQMHADCLLPMKFKMGMELKSLWSLWLFRKYLGGLLHKINILIL